MINNKVPLPKTTRPTLEERLEWLHERFFQIREGGKTFIGDREAVDIYTEVMQIESFRRLFDIGKINGKDPILLWLKDPSRKQFLDGFTFDPSNPHGDLGKQFNLYEGFSVVPTAGECDLIIKHIREVLCSGSREQFEFFMGWLASSVQHPELVLPAVVVLQSGEGTGKSLIIEMMVAIHGKQGLTLDRPAHFSGDFNGHLGRRTLVALEEFSTGGKFSITDALKSQSTSDLITINAKYREPIKVKNHAKYMVSTNHEWALVASKESRRWFIPDISDHRVGDNEYFTALATQCKSRLGQAAFLHYLLKYDLSSWIPDGRPETVALARQRGTTLDKLDPLGSWYGGILSTGCIDERFGIDWPSDGIVATNTLKESYTNYVDRHKNAPNWEQAVKNFSKFNPAYFKKRGSKQGDRSYRYHLGDIHQARKAFTKATGITLPELPAEYGEVVIQAFHINNNKRVVDMPRMH